MQHNSAVLESESVAIENGSNTAVVESAPETVAAVPADQPNKTLKIRFVEEGGTSKRSPKYRGILYLDGALTGKVMETAIFQDEEDGSFSAAMPGGRFKAIKTAPQIIVAKDDTEHLIAVPDTGAAKAWNEAIMPAFHKFRETGIAEQFVTFQ